ncbi:MAG: 3-hydroxyacyl-CoA dehydrogenase NAD-binding domain-containing protein [bacterium]|jgi:3-hydroxyacyl-CoA dehydrogenase/enoyl-CoA hydratase/3-hydroxybutyryl-CoA epimerase
MIDLNGLPIPPDAPMEGACIRIEHPEPGLAVIVLDPPHRSLAVLDLCLMRDLDLALDKIERESGLKGLVIRGKEPLSFAAGADIDAIEEIREIEIARRVLALGQAVFQRIDRLRARGIRTVAAVGGPVPGGAFELSMACARIVLADDPKSRIGLPETKLGILPAWGGCQRLPRRIGVPAAMAAILSGTLLPARAAYKKGFVDRLTPPEYLVRVASDIAMGRTRCKRRERGIWAFLIDRNPLALWIIERQTKQQIQRQTRGQYPAANAVARLVAWAPLKSIDKGLADEVREASKLAIGEVSKNLVGIFKLMEGAKRLGKREDGSKPEPIERAAVTGAGVMGGAIASSMATKGIACRLFDISPAGLDAAQFEHRRDLAKLRKRRRIQPHEERDAIDRLDTATLLVGFSRTQLVVEAVAERMEVKRAVFADLAAALPDDAILATNTSSLSVSAIAEGLSHPERVVGLHFFNPVKKMPLVEIVRGKATSSETVTRAAALALALGKTPVVVADVAGFLVNRLLGPYLDEALRLYAGGVEPARLDRLAREFGMPMGPLRLLDEVGLDIAAHAAESLHTAYGGRMAPCTAIRGLLDAGHLGKKTGDGFYVHLAFDPKARPVLASDLAHLAPPLSSHEEFLTDDQIVDRLILAMLGEATRCLEEDVVSGPRELDLATVFGMGFPPFRGGLLRWADTLGAEEVVRRMEHCASSVANAPEPERQERFAVPERLRTMAADKTLFHG